MTDHYAPRYAHHFSSEDGIQYLIQLLREGDTAITVGAVVLRQWYMQYHPAAGPLQYGSALDLEEALGDELRTVYGHFTSTQCRGLAHALQCRRKSVLVSQQTAKTWLTNYAASSISSITRKRPASSDLGAVRKRPASVVCQSPAVETAYIALQTAEDIERSCGIRYREEVSDKGLGLGRIEMRSRLLSWGFEVSAKACEGWLEKYRMGIAGVHGNTAVFELSRQILQRWYFVDHLSAFTIRQKYLAECGVWAHDRNIKVWLDAPAQQLPHLCNNEDVHSHPCGDFVLQQLQEGVSPREVVDRLLEQYLVVTTVERLTAYRYYREQKSEYWSTERLVHDHWEYLYKLVSLDMNYSRYHHRHMRASGKALDEHLVGVREVFARDHQIAEEFIPLPNLAMFYHQHHAHAMLPLIYPNAKCFVDSVPVCAVDILREMLRDTELPETAYAFMKQDGIQWQNRIVRLAGDHNLIVFPKAEAEACQVVAYAMFPSVSWRLFSVAFLRDYIV